jgi:hypothetical protein
VIRRFMAQLFWGLGRCGDLDPSHPAPKAMRLRLGKWLPFLKKFLRNCNRCG